MKKYLNKALIYKEWKNVWWFVLLCTAILGFIKYSKLRDIVNIMGDSNSFQQLADYFSRVISENGDTQVLYIIGEILLAFLIFGLDRRKNYDKLSSMPFTRKQIINSKIFVALISVLIILTVSLIIIVIGYFTVYSSFMGKVSLLPVFEWYSINLLTAISTVIFFGMIQSFTGVAILGSVVGVILLAVPYGLYEVFNYIRRMNVSMNAFYLERTYIHAFPNVKLNPLEQVLKNMNFSVYGVIYERNLGYTISCLILLAISILFYLMLVKSFEKNSFDKTGYVAMFPFVEYTFKLGVSICSALLIVCVTIGDIAYKVDYTTGYKFLLVLEFSVSALVIYFIMCKIVSLSKR